MTKNKHTDLSLGRGWAQIRDSDLIAMRPYIEDKTVYDLGSGRYYEGAQVAVALGATKVYAVDSCFDSYKVRSEKIDLSFGEALGIQFIGEHFDAVQIPKPKLEHPQGHYTVLLFWPDARPLQGLLNLLKHADTIIYKGVNDKITACGFGDLFKSFLRRPVLYHESQKHETFIKDSTYIYGPSFAEDTRDREPFDPEEEIGLDLFG